jgi:hypothetical protein
LTLSYNLSREGLPSGFAWAGAQNKAPDAREYRKMARAKAWHGNVLILDKLMMRYEGDELFLYQGGKRIAKRGHSGTRHAGQWLPLEPGIDVREVRKGSERAVDVVYDANSRIA